MFVSCSCSYSFRFVSFLFQGKGGEGKGGDGRVGGVGDNYLRDQDYQELFTRGTVTATARLPVVPVVNLARTEHAGQRNGVA